MSRAPTTDGARLIPILGDQLSHHMTSLRAGEPSRDLVLMAEVADETTYVPHHKKKIAFIFAAMRHFAGELSAHGWRVRYVTLDAPGNTGSLAGEVVRAVQACGASGIIVTEPGEWRVLSQMRTWGEAAGVPIDILDDERFIASHARFRRWADGKKTLRMEHFYREMRRETGLLMDGAEPLGGQWNFDHENRKPAKPDLFMPEPLRFEPDVVTREVIDLVERRFGRNFGKLEPFWFAVQRRDALRQLDHFIATGLRYFGDFQDAMLKDNRFLYHSLLSMYLNVGLLDAREICARVDRAYRDGDIPLNSAEGYIRQIIGWREYVRGIYWLKMPKYVDENALGHDRPIPDFYWTGNTDMACLAAAIGQTRDEAYAHHIQRLMVTGNFALLAGVDPRDIHEWYLAVYADAFEWVELPNTLGMSQYADGGLLGSKPYAASGAYINRMSDYCRGCRYDVKQRTGDDACPFNALYWDFIARHEGTLARNPRMAQIYASWRKMPEATRLELRASAGRFLATLKPWLRSVADGPGASPSGKRPSST
ncbi:MAG: cryptochrome/photolyase family protein [Hyphomicrobium sp.]|nr:cryptochrome/photolyase family protein [Hyphomicrobium sp.]